MDQTYDSLMQIIRQRRSVRRFKPDPVPRDKVDQLLEAARWAPSAGNRQSWRMWLISSPARRREMVCAVQEHLDSLETRLRSEARTEAESYLKNFTHFGQAPLVIAFIYRSGVDLLQASLEGEQRGATRTQADGLCSCAAAIQNLLLACKSLNLGACWMTGPLVAQPELERVLDLPPGWTLAALVPVGLPAEQPQTPSRRALSRLVRRID